MQVESGKLPLLTTDYLSLTVYSKGIKMIALSTAYNIKKHLTAHTLVEEIKELGFSAVELNVEVTKGFIPGIARELKISSVHNFCPKVDFVPPGKTIYSPYNISSTDADELKTAVELTKKTVDVAADVGAGAIVIHSGEVVTEFTGRMLAKAYNETKGTASYKSRLAGFVNERKSKSKEYFDNVLSSLDNILNYAVKKKIKLGIENRFWANEIPSLDEFDKIFKKLDSEYIGLWYDVGHAVIAEKQGLVKNRLDFLEQFGAKLIGVHLHDVVDVYDHKAPGTGEVDFKKMSAYFKNNTIFVNETHSSASKEEIMNSTKYLNDRGIK